MNDFLALDLSAAGMRAQRMRMQVVAENLANQDTTGPNGPYRRKEAVLQSTSVDFGKDLSEAMNAEASAIRSVAIAGVSVDPAEPVRVYDPSHPNADAQGYVLKPNISPVREMTDMIDASHAYEANLAAAKATQEMLNAAISLLAK